MIMSSTDTDVAQWRPGKVLWMTHLLLCKVTKAATKQRRHFGTFESVTFWSLVHLCKQASKHWNSSLFWVAFSNFNHYHHLRAHFDQLTHVGSSNAIFLSMRENSFSAVLVSSAFLIKAYELQALCSITTYGRSHYFAVMLSKSMKLLHQEDHQCQRAW